VPIRKRKTFLIYQKSMRLEEVRKKNMCRPEIIIWQIIRMEVVAVTNSYLLQISYTNLLTRFLPASSNLRQKQAWS